MSLEVLNPADPDLAREVLVSKKHFVSSGISTFS